MHVAQRPVAVSPACQKGGIAGGIVFMPLSSAGRGMQQANVKIILQRVRKTARKIFHNGWRMVTPAVNSHTLLLQEDRFYCLRGQILDVVRQAQPVRDYAGSIMIAANQVNRDVRFPQAGHLRGKK